jgi:hypothetical protein
MTGSQRASDDPFAGDVLEGGAMTTKELHQRRAETSALLPALILRRDHAFQLKCDAEKLDRFGVTHHTEAEMTRLAEDQAAADAAMRDIQLQLRDIDDQIRSASGSGFTATISRVLPRR